MYRFSIVCVFILSTVWTVALRADETMLQLQKQLATTSHHTNPSAETAWAAGVLSLGFTAEGLLGTCGEPPVHFSFAHRVIIRTTFGRLDGVCDDASDRPCAGRLTQLSERCTADDLHYQLTDHQGVDYIRAKVRICFDPTAEGNCDDVDVVASGTMASLLPGNFSSNPAAEGTFDQTSQSENILRITDSKRFKLDGKRVKISKGIRTGSGMSRVSTACLFQTNACPSVLQLENTR